MKANPEMVKKQYDYMRKLKKMKGRRLRKHHKDVMSMTKYWVPILTAPRSHLEKRLFYYFCLCHYHYPKGSTPRITFFRMAKKFLRTPYKPLPEAEEEKRKRREQYEQTVLFTKDNIKEFHINQVDKYLAMSGIYVDISGENKRKLLWELHRLPIDKLPKTLNEEGKLVSPRSLSALRMQNKFILRDLIAKYPTMTYGQFIERFGDKMPTCSRASFKVTRSQLKKAGYNIPDLRGQAQAVIRNGKATERGRDLED